MRWMILVAAWLAAGSAHAVGDLLEDQPWAATYSQNGLHPSYAVDGVLPNHSGGTSDDHKGWGLWYAGAYQDADAVFESSANVGSDQITIALDFRYANRFLLGYFQLLATDDDRTNFADNDPVGGQMGSSWTSLTNPSAYFFDYSASGALATPSVLSMDPVRSNGATGEIFAAAAGVTYPTTGSVGYPGGASYYLVFDNPFSAESGSTGLTGVRLNTLYHSDLPSNGPGVVSGNMVLTEIRLFEGAAVPEASTGLLVLIGLAGLVARRRAEKQD